MRMSKPLAAIEDQRQGRRKWIYEKLEVRWWMWRCKVIEVNFKFDRDLSKQVSSLIVR